MKESESVSDLKVFKHSKGKRRRMILFDKTFLAKEREEREAKAAIKEKENQ